ncbi:hypothetical protein JTE90_009613 [Oedothorax gibbosus]|uniref:Uncharacterized protein n=1 Tax=Oedothorax gibbosus TaxID=931172 RepID=A0AAV6TGT0_9ARAC|nr:hypothetical protein JTE90_009613 [Oedothorax gibbosus]
MGLAPTLGNSPGQGDLLQSPSPARSLLNATFPHALASGGFGAGLLPVHSPLLRESLLVSFPPLIYMLKFSGLSHGSRLTTSRAAYCSGARKQQGKKDDKRVELATRTAFNSHPPAARCYDHNMHHIPTEIISAMERHGTGAGPLAEKLRREGSRPD